MSDRPESKRVTAGVLAILLGSLGVHKFYLGFTVAGIIHLVLFPCTLGCSSVISLIEGIMYLTKTDEEFIDTYQIGKKQWF
jgi:TM2 domain-containing membrane protein YozV